MLMQRDQRGLAFRCRQRRRLGQFDDQPVSRQARALTDPGDPRTKAHQAEAGGREVHRHREIMPKGMPEAAIPRRALQHHQGQRDDRAAGLGLGQEGGRAERAALRMVPAQQRFRAHGEPVGDAQDRLVPGQQLAARQRVQHVGAADRAEAAGRPAQCRQDRRGAAGRRERRLHREAKPPRDPRGLGGGEDQRGRASLPRQGLKQRGALRPFAGLRQQEQVRWFRPRRGQQGLGAAEAFGAIEFGLTQAAGQTARGGIGIQHMQHGRVGRHHARSGLACITKPSRGLG